MGCYRVFSTRFYNGVQALSKVFNCWTGKNKLLAMKKPLRILLAAFRASLFSPSAVQISLAIFRLRHAVIGHSSIAGGGWRVADGEQLNPKP